MGIRLFDRFHIASNADSERCPGIHIHSLLAGCSVPVSLVYMCVYAPNIPQPGRREHPTPVLRRTRLAISCKLAHGYAYAFERLDDS